MAKEFHINQHHVTYIRALAKTKDEIIIHGSGQIFSCNDSDPRIRVYGEKGIELVSPAIRDSDFHRTFRSGFDEREDISIGKYRAIYRKDDKLPKTPEEIIEAFYKQENDMIRNQVKPQKQASNILVIEPDKQTSEAELKAKEEAELKVKQQAEEKAKEDVNIEIKAKNNVPKGGKKTPPKRNIKK
jgi:hypothetical protein